MLPMRAGRETLLRGLHHALGIPGLIIGTLSLLMVLFGAIVFEREYDRLARARSAIVQRLVSRWVRTASADYLNTNNLVDAAERWRGLDPDDSEARQAVVRALARMGEWLQTQNERTPVLEILAVRLTRSDDPRGIDWTSRAASSAEADQIDSVPILAVFGGLPSVACDVRFRVEPEIAQIAASLETSYRRLLLSVLGLSGYSMLCLVYMGWHAHATRSRSAREAAQQATLDLADRTCHELGNVAFVLANERRNLAEYLGRTEAFAEQHPELVARALERANVPEDLAARIRRALAREMEDRGFEADSQEGSRLARETCHQIDVCADFIALTVRELDGYLRQTQMPVRLTALDVSDCLDDALALLGPGLAAADARVDRRDRDGDRARALADRRLLVHALVNVLKNGLEAARSVGRTPILKVSVQPRGNRLVIEVDDNGPGIPPEIRRTLFQPGTSTKGQGRGRGLAIVKDALAAQGGEVEVESVLGAGATFRINLPVAAGEHER